MNKIPITLWVSDLIESNEIYKVAKERLIKAEPIEIDIEKLKKHTLLLEEIEGRIIKKTPEYKSDPVSDAVKILIKNKGY